MKTKHIALAAITASLATVSTTHAAVVYTGSQLNIDGTGDDGATIGWHSTLQSKPLDIDGDNALGTDGWVRAGSGTGGVTNPNRLIPSYLTAYVGDLSVPLTSTSGVNSQFANAGSGLIDAPTTASPGINPTAEATANVWHSNSANAFDVYTFTIQNAALLTGQSLRVGLLFDATLVGTQVFTMTQTVGGTDTATSGSLAHNADGLDVAFFTLSGLADGDRFVVNADSTSRSHLAGITFDSAIPEPSAALLGSLGLLALLRRRRA